VDCAGFRASYERWWNQGPVDNEYPREQQEWFKHRQDCPACHEWGRQQYCQHRGIEPAQHCCLDLAYAIAHPVEILHQGPNRALDWSRAWDEYWIPVPYDGYSANLIRYCPWCGTRLPHSKKEQWYQALYALGFDDPGEQAIPAEFRSDRWWRERNQ